MANEQNITIIGRLTNDPELRFTPAGAAVANFTIASNSRTFNKQTNEWTDDPANFWRCSVWRELAENMAESLVKGSAVIAQGIVKTRAYVTKEGENRSAIEVEVQSIGPDLRWATAKPQKVARGNGEGAAGRAASNGSWTPPAAAAPDPWATPATTNTGWGGNSNPSQQEPPF